MEVFGADADAALAEPHHGQRARLPEPSDVAEGNVEMVGDLAKGQERRHREPLGGTRGEIRGASSPIYGGDVACHVRTQCWQPVWPATAAVMRRERLPCA